MDKELNFEDYGIKFSDNDFKGVTKETLEKCLERIKLTKKNLENKNK